MTVTFSESGVEEAAHACLRNAGWQMRNGAVIASDELYPLKGAQTFRRVPIDG
jgi:hypothetical protein